MKFDLSSNTLRAILIFHILKEFVFNSEKIAFKTGCKLCWKHITFIKKIDVFIFAMLHNNSYKMLKWKENSAETCWSIG